MSGLIEAFFYVKPADWNTVDVDTETTALSKSALSVFTQAKTGFWNAFTGGYEVYNAPCYRADVEEIKIALAAYHNVFIWDFDTGFDAWNDDGTFNTIPADILAVMKDHVVYDENGIEISRTPATYENPNWGHSPFKPPTPHLRVFAGDASDDFNEDFF